MRVLVSSSVKRSVNQWALKTEKLPSSSTSHKSAPTGPRASSENQNLELRHFFARTAWSQRKFQISAKNCAKFVHEHSRKPHPDSLRELCRCIPAQISHNLSTFLEAPHIFRTIFLGPVGNAPRTSFAQFSQAHGLYRQ